MKVKTHEAIKVVSSVAGFLVGGTLVAFNSANLESAGHPVNLIFFVAVNAGWIIPTLFFKLILSPKCGSKGKYIWRRKTNITEFSCNKCGYIEKTRFTYPSGVN